MGGKKYLDCYWDAAARPDGGILESFSCNKQRTYGRYSSLGSDWTHVTGSGTFSLCHLYCIQQ